jgi:type II secretory pathway component GspD/PulD (secretin)
MLRKPTLFIACALISKSLAFCPAQASDIDDGAQVSVTVYLVNLSKEGKEAVAALNLPRDDQERIHMTEAQFKECFGRIQQDRSNSIMMAPKISTTSGQKAKIDVTEDYVYVKAVHVESEAGKQTIRTETDKIPLGVRFQVQPTVSANRKSINVNLIGYLADLTGPTPSIPVQTVDANQKPVQTYIQLPNVNKIEFEKTLAIVDGETLLFPIRQIAKESQTKFEHGGILAKIPYLQRLLVNTAYGSVVTELCVMVTATVVEKR